MPAKALVVAILGCLTRRIMCGRTIAWVIRHCIVEPAAVIHRSSTRGNFAAGRLLISRNMPKSMVTFAPTAIKKTWIRYGRNPGGTQRLQCQYCKKVWTPKQHALNVAETPEQICSIPLLVPFQGANAFQQLYFLFSFDAVRGNVLHLSSNFTLLSAGKSLHYHWKGIAPPEGEDGDIIHRIAIKERQFLQRSQFDEIQYGPAALKRNAQGTILRPVITAHGHFRVLKNRFPDVTTHIIAHECFFARRGHYGMGGAVSPASLLAVVR